MSEYDKIRPVFKLENGIKVLFDTGAEHPIWCSTSEISEYYENSYTTEKKFIIGGLTGKKTISNENIIPQFEITGENNSKLTLKNLSIGVIKSQEFDFDMILSPSALAIANFYIQQLDFNGKSIDRTKRKLIIESPRDNLFCIVNAKELQIGKKKERVINYYSCYISNVSQN